MKIETVQIDGKMPNLALLKLRAWHQAHGDQVNGSETPDIVYISCIFTWNASTARGVATTFPGSKVRLGGSGLNLSDKLPLKVESMKVDWAAEGMNYAIGFSSRGCIRACPFCIVHEKEGNLYETSNIVDIAGDMGKVVLLDNNFLASPRLIEKCAELTDNDYAVNFNQGLDIRLVNQQIAYLLKDIRYYDWRFNHRTLFFAWDNPTEERQIMRGIDFLKSAGIPTKDMTFYVLVGFDTTFDQDQYRVQKLLDNGIHPQILLYNNTKDKTLRAYAKYVNRRYYKVCDWLDFRGRPKA